MLDLPPTEQLKRSLEAHEAARHAEAEAGYRAVLRSAPDHPDALHLLGVLCTDTARLPEAVALLRRAILLQPQNPAFHLNLGNALRASGDAGGAIDAWRRAVELQPDSVEAHANLGAAMFANGQLDDAAAMWRRVVELAPDWSEGHLRLGETLHAMGESAAAEPVLRRAASLDPGRAEIVNALGICLAKLRRFGEAAAQFQAAAQQLPDLPPVLVNLGQALWESGRATDAEPIFRRAAAIDDRFAPAHHGLSVSLKSLGRLGEALAEAKRAVALAGDWADAYHGLGNILHEMGRVADALAAYRRAIELNPVHRDAHSSMLLVCHYLHGDEPQSMFDEHLAWARQHEAPILAKTETGSRLTIPPPRGDIANGETEHADSSSPNRKLRIAYISPDLRRHAVSHFFEPLLNAHDRGNFHITCYASVVNEDDVSRRLASKSDAWRNVAETSDDDLAGLIRADGVDILVDLAGHTAGNRLLAFARRPAPVQMSYLGYPNTTGMRSVDYVITDQVQDPPGTETFHTEKLIRLPRSMHCYHPPEDCPEVVAREAGSMRFGSFNRLEKMSPLTVELWSAALRAVPGATLTLKSPALSEPVVREEAAALFARHGVEPDRLILLARDPSPAGHMRRYAQVDIALDMFPYNGTTTTCESLWMGVPVITLAGRTRVTRTTAGILDAIGLKELVATSLEEFAQIAMSLAHDSKRLSELRATMRERMMNSPLMDGASLARAIEQAYRRAWEEGSPQPRSG